MTPEELRSRARRIPEELLTQGDLAVADEVVAPDCVHHVPVPAAPGSGGMKRWVVTLRRAFPDLCAVVEDEIVEGHTAVQRLTLSGTHAGAFLGLPPTGAYAVWELVVIQRVGRGGKFTEHWAVADHLGLLVQLRAKPTTLDPP